MFQQPFNFSLQRTAIQAVGWYLFFTLMSFLAGAFVGLVVGAISGTQLNYIEGTQLGARIAPVIPILLGVLLLRKRPLTARNVIIAPVALVVSFPIGFLGAGILLAYLTTQPLKESPASQADTFS